MNISKTFPVFLFLIFIFFSKCDSTEPPPPDNRKINLTFEDASCTEVWLNLETGNVNFPAEAIIKADDSIAQNIILTNADTIVYVDSLLPNKTYTIQAFIHSSNQPELPSNKITATTMDTTSHNFTWQTFTFGEHSSSVFYDVAIIDENNIWAVGGFYMNDSLGQHDPNAYNAVHWDGSEWELERILYDGNIWTITTIFAFNENDIWFSSFVRFDGENFVELPIPSILMGWRPNKIWGSSSSDLYVVGNEGNIAHYQNGQWRKIESGTSLNINGIWGDYNERANEWEILAVGGNILQSTERIILQIKKGNQVQQISSEGTIEYPISGVWFKSGLKYYISGDGMYSNTNLNKPWQNLSLPNYYGFSIRGQELNNIVVCGGAGYVGHFNGYTWKNYLDEGLGEITGNYYSIAIKGNIISAVGNTAEGEAITVIGKR
jgi:hypothetical protein